MKHHLFIVSGPSGVGKGTLVKLLHERLKIALSISYTTRNARPGEKEGKDYYFITQEQFKEKIQQGDFLEYSQHFGNYYGTSLKIVQQELLNNDLILEINPKGAFQVRKIFPQAFLIMILPPSLNALRERIKLRASETIEEINLRLANFTNDISQCAQYDYLVVNDDLEIAYKQLTRIMLNPEQYLA